MDLLPLEVYDEPWLVEKKTIVNKLIEILHVRREEVDGIWALYFNDKSLMNEIWKLAVKSFREGKLNGVYSIKCSTNYVNPKGITPTTGMLIFNCSLPPDEETILELGKNILESFNYDERRTIYYKFNEYKVGASCYPNSRSYTYKLDNHLYELKNTKFMVADDNNHY